jgi:pimeloyl-ACP methyl ester carboxylesterase
VTDPSATPTGPGSPAERTSPGVEPATTIVTTGDGRRLHVLRWPAPAGAPVVLFLHGGGLTGYTWSRVAEALGDGVDRIAPDLRGHGSSDWHADGDYRLEAFADDLVDLRAALGIRRAIVVGMSLGANVGLVDAALHPDAVAGLVMVDAGPPGSRAEGRDRIAALMTVRTFDTFETALAAALEIDPDRDPERLRRSLARNLIQGADGRWSWRWDPRIRWRSAAASPEEERRLAAERSEALWAAAAAVTAPVVVVRGGDSDMFSPEDAAATAHGFADAELVTIDGARHAVQVDRPVELAAAIRAFVDRVSGDARNVSA